MNPKREEALFALALEKPAEKRTALLELMSDGDAALRGHLKVMRLLLDRQANANLADSGGNTPLIHAAMRGRTDAVRLLLAHGSKVNAASSHGWTPLMAAAWEGHTSIVKLLPTK